MNVPSFPLLLLLLAAAGLSAQSVPFARPFSRLGVAREGTLSYCTNCTVATPCAAGGTGALAVRRAGAWACNHGSGDGSGSSSANAVTRASAATAAGRVPRSAGANRELQDSLVEVDDSGNIITPGRLQAGAAALGLEGECVAPGSVVAPTQAGAVVVFCDSTESGRLATKNTAGTVQKYLRDGEVVTAGGGPIWSCVSAPSAALMANAVTALGQVSTGCTIPAGTLIAGRLLRWEVLGSWDGGGGGFRWTVRAPAANGAALVDLAEDKDAYTNDSVGVISARGTARVVAANQIFSAETRSLAGPGPALTVVGMGYALNGGVVEPLPIDLSVARPLDFNFSRVDAGARLRFRLFRVWVEAE